jgi:hypothetical protein
VNIEVSFENWKSLTAMLQSESDSYDLVVSRLLAVTEGRRSISTKATAPLLRAEADYQAGAYFKEVFFPEGTRLRATYKGKTYFASITGEKWIDSESGEVRSSPSQAAYSITGSGVNGWNFWYAKRPEDVEWYSLNFLRILS